MYHIINLVYAMRFWNKVHVQVYTLWSLKRLKIDKQKIIWQRPSRGSNKKK